jgi:methionyl-tRNA formyltransferase
MRLIFMGSPAFSVPTLDALTAAGHDIVCVYSQPPKPAGRGKSLRPTPVHTWAQERGLNVRTPRSLKSPEEQAAFAALNADAAIVVAYGLILPQAVLDAPRLGCFNLHGSLLPRWRGAAPLQRAIEAGDRVTGVQVMGMEAGLDTGPVYATHQVEIGPRDTTGTIHDRLSVLGGDLMVQALAGIAAGRLHPVAQSPDGVTYAAKIERSETRIDWSKDGRTIDCAIRAFSPSPGAWCMLPDGTRAKILLSCFEEANGSKPGEALDDRLLIGCGTGAVRLLTLQREAKSAMDADTFLRGTPIAKGCEFG